MNVWEILGMGFMILIGAIAMFFVQPKLYESGTIPLNDVDPTDWVSNEYMMGAGVVFGVSVVLVITWYCIGSLAKISGSWDVPAKKPLWLLFLFISTVSIFMGVWLSCKYLSGASEEALYTLFPLFFINIVWLYWLTTAMTSPNNLKFVPLGAFFLRRIFDR